jgi:hypothetical protein
MIRFESPREVGEEATGCGDVGTAIGALQDRLRPGPLSVRQVIEDVPQLVHLTPLEQRDGAEEIYDACNQGPAIRFVDDVLRRLPFGVPVVQTDNGAAFQAHFQWHLEALDIRHV